MRSGVVWILRNWLHQLVELIENIQKISILFYYIINSALRMCPKIQFFQVADCEICIPAIFGFWENGFSGLVELIKYKQETSKLCYYTIHDALRMCPKSEFFLGAGCKIYVPAKFGFWEKGLCGLIELIKYKTISILCYIQFKAPYTCAEKSVFLGGWL